MIGEVPYEFHATVSVGSTFVRRELHVSDTGILQLNVPIGLAACSRRWWDGIDISR